MDQQKTLTPLMKSASISDYSTQEYTSLLEQYGEHMSEIDLKQAKWIQVRRLRAFRDRISNNLPPQLPTNGKPQIKIVDADYALRSVDRVMLDQLTSEHMTPQQSRELSQIIGMVRSWRKRKQARNACILFSPRIGVGKTHIARAVADSYLRIMCPDGTYKITDGNPNWWVIKESRFVTSFELMKMMDNPDYSHEALIKNARCLVIDEVGRESTLKFEKRDEAWQKAAIQDRYFELINWLYEWKREVALFMTSNLDTKQLEAHFNPATWSRLIEMTDGMLLPIKSEWPDYRKRGKS